MDEAIWTKAAGQFYVLGIRLAQCGLIEGERLILYKVDRCRNCVRDFAGLSAPGLGTVEIDDDGLDKTTMT